MYLSPDSYPQGLNVFFKSPHPKCLTASSNSEQGIEFSWQKVRGDLLQHQWETELYIEADSQTAREHDPHLLYTPTSANLWEAVRHFLRAITNSSLETAYWSSDGCARKIDKHRNTHTHTLAVYISHRCKINRKVAWCHFKQILSQYIYTTWMNGSRTSTRYRVSIDRPNGRCCIILCTLLKTITRFLGSFSPSIAWI